jgi:hypothetical protein
MLPFGRPHTFPVREILENGYLNWAFLTTAKERGIYLVNSLICGKLNGINNSSESVFRIYN